MVASLSSSPAAPAPPTASSTASLSVEGKVAAFRVTQLKTWRGRGAPAWATAKVKAMASKKASEAAYARLAKAQAAAAAAKAAADAAIAAATSLPPTTPTSNGDEAEEGAEGEGSEGAAEPLTSPPASHTRSKGGLGGKKPSKRGR